MRVHLKKNHLIRISHWRSPELYKYKILKVSFAYGPTHMSRRETAQNNVAMSPIINGKKSCWGSSNQKLLWTSSICTVLRMKYWFTRLWLGLLCKSLCDIYGVSESNLFPNAILLKPDLVVPTHDFHSSNSRMIHRASEKNPLTISIVTYCLSQFWKGYCNHKLNLLIGKKCFSH